MLAAVGAGLFALGHAVFAPQPSWTDAYVALEANDGASDRVAIANAMVDSEPPTGMALGPRLHPPGSLVRLDYETFDDIGTSIDRWTVRALVPALPYMPDHAGAEAPLAMRDGCPEECRREAERGALILQRSGDAGLAAEWVLRMPLGRVFDLGARPVTTQDLLDPQPRRLGIRSERRDGRMLQIPANIRVTVQDVCAARARLGSVQKLDFHPTAIIPIPRGFRTHRWIQIDNCDRIEQ